MLHAVIMAGGSGTRFWPKSRRNRPKQLLRLHGDATMLQQTVERIAPLVRPETTWVITGEDQAEAVRAQLPKVPASNVVAEPCPRDTAACVGLAGGAGPKSPRGRGANVGADPSPRDPGACVGLAAMVLAARDPGGTMIVMPADHVIEPPERFRATVLAALSVVDQDPTAFVTFGV